MLWNNGDINNDGSSVPYGKHSAKRDAPKCLLRAGELIPYLEINEIRSVVLEAVWDDMANYSFHELMQMNPKLTQDDVYEVQEMQKQQEVILSYYCQRQEPFIVEMANDMADNKEVEC